MLFLLVLVPVVIGVNIIGAVALVVGLTRHPDLRVGVGVLALVVWLVHPFLGNLDELLAPGGALNNDRLAGEHWALESGASTRQDCERQSSSRAFREGCYGRLRP